MLVKAVTLFLIAMLVLGMFGKLRAPKIRKTRDKDRLAGAKKCTKCGTYVIGAGPCACGEKK